MVSKKKTRPSCPECKSENPISRGSSWECSKCGRRFQKHYRGPFKSQNNETYLLNMQKELIVSNKVVTI